MDISETRKTFDFSKEKVQTITLAELEATYKENDVYGRPLGGIYHSDLINGISNMARNAGLEVEMGDMFAVNNLDGKRPGVALLPEVEEKEGERSIRAHLLRRVFATIRMAPTSSPRWGAFVPPLQSAIRSMAFRLVLVRTSIFAAIRRFSALDR